MQAMAPMLLPQAPPQQGPITSAKILFLAGKVIKLGSHPELTRYGGDCTVYPYANSPYILFISKDLFSHRPSTK